MQHIRSSLPAEVSAILDRATVASAAYGDFDRAKVSRIVEAVARVADEHSERLGHWAAEETGFGVAEHKVAKNRNTVREFMRQYGSENYCDHRIDRDAKILRTPRPAGVIFGVTQSTSPTAAVIFKVLSALLTRNVIVISPHPAAKHVCHETIRLLATAAESAGAPRDVIQAIEDPNIPLVEAVMGDTRTRLILATGGAGVVRSAYRSGRPALGVGPGNPPIVVDETADLRLAAKGMVESKTFDNSVLCTADSAVFAVESIAATLQEYLRAEGAHVCGPDETRRLRDYIWPAGIFNTKAVGRTALELAEAAGLRVPFGTRVLVTPFNEVDESEWLTHEKLCPVLAFQSVANFEMAMSNAKKMLSIVGAGHSAGIYSTNPQRVLDYSYELPVYRVAVNVSASLHNAGIGTHLPVTMSVGTGYLGGSSSADNLNPEHLVQWNQTAYSADPAVEFPDFSSLRRSNATNGTSPAADGDILLELRRIVLEELHSLLRPNHG